MRCGQSNCSLMYNQRVIGRAGLPIGVEQRRTTDVLCSWLHALLVLALLAAALAAPAAPTRAPPGRTGTAARVSCPQDYQELWQWGQSEGEVCVQVCPNNFRNIGAVCFPLPRQQLQQYLRLSPLAPHWEAHYFPKIVGALGILAVSMSLVVLTLSYFAPTLIQRLTIVLALLALIYLGLLLTDVLAWPVPLSQQFSSLSFRERHAGVLVVGLLGVVLVVWVVGFRKEHSWNGLVMDSGSKMLPERMSFILLVAKYYVGVAVAVALCAFQGGRFSGESWVEWWSIAPGWSVLQVLNIFEYFWTLQYLKDTLYFSLANLATAHYFSSEMDCCGNLALNCAHTGSTSGGALLNLLFYLPNCLLDALCCFPQERRENCGLWCTSLTGIARQDAYAYQAIAGIPYCNAARECRRLANESILWTGTNSPLASFRFFLHILLNAACLAFGGVLMRMQLVEITAWRAFTLFTIGESVMSGLVDVVAIMGESLQTALLVDSAVSSEGEHACEATRGLREEVKEYLRGRQPINPFAD